MAVCRIMVPCHVFVNFAFPSAQIAPPFSTTPSLSSSLFYHEVFWKPVHKIVKSNWESPWKGGSLRTCGGAKIWRQRFWLQVQYSFCYVSLELPRFKSNTGLQPLEQEDKSHLLDPLLEALQQLHLQPYNKQLAVMLGTITRAWKHQLR